MEEEERVRVVSNGTLHATRVTLGDHELIVRRVEWVADASDRSGLPRIVLHADLADVDLAALPTETIIILEDPIRPYAEDIADWLGEMDEAANIFDHTDEATTVITIDVETLAHRIAQFGVSPTPSGPTT